MICMRKTFTFSISSSGCSFNFLPSTIAWQHVESDYTCLGEGHRATEGVLSYVLTLVTTDTVKGLLIPSSAAGLRHWEPCVLSQETHYANPVPGEEERAGRTHPSISFPRVLLRACKGQAVGARHPQ